MSNAKDNNSLKGDRRSIALVAASSVDGYLRNASRRHRVPAAEGGRGTRRKLAMVTSATVAETSGGAAPAVDVDDEWDEVDLPAVPVKKQETVKTDISVTDSTVLASIETSAKQESGLPVVKDESAPSGQRSTAPPECVTKAECVIVDDGAPGGDMNQITDDTGLPRGTRPPLIERPQRTAWRHQNDPAYAAIREQADLIAAQRRSDRIQRTCTSITSLLILLERGRLLWREAHHPKLARALLRLRTLTDSKECDTTQDCRPRHKAARKEVGCSAADKAGRAVLSNAVTSARAVARQSNELQYSKPSLAPLWVTLARDTAQNKTSEAVMTLLKAMNSVFVLEPSSAASSTDILTTAAIENISASAACDSAEDGMLSAMENWAVPIAPGFLYAALRKNRVLAEEQRIGLPHSLYFSVIFVALASMASMPCRLVVARQAKKETSEHEQTRDGNTSNGDDTSAPQKLEKISVFYRDPKPRKRGRQCGEGGGADDADQVKSKKLPSSCYWAEVWSNERKSFIAVNPCPACATLWGTPFVFSVGGDVIVDATARYTSRYSSAFSMNRRIGRVNQFGFLWPSELHWDDSREVSEVLLESYSRNPSQATRQRLVREKKQLESLMYSETIPTTLTGLHKHPLFVIESDLARHEGVYPKDANTTVGRVKGHTVYKQSAVVSLRSRDGWLREGKSLKEDDEPAYKTVPPPASRPFAAPSMFYGQWQTKPFEPLPLREDKSIPHHGRTSWYILLDAKPPSTMVHLTEPQIARVARRMQLDFGLAVVGFQKRQAEERRRGHWESVIDGIVVRKVDEQRLLHAYKEWIQLVQEQEAAKRRDRAMHWWGLFIQRSLAIDRLRAQYLDGAARTGFPAH